MPRCGSSCSASKTRPHRFDAVPLVRRASQPQTEPLKPRTKRERRHAPLSRDVEPHSQPANLCVCVCAGALLPASLVGSPARCGRFWPADRRVAAAVQHHFRPHARLRPNRRTALYLIGPLQHALVFLRRRHELGPAHSVLIGRRAARSPLDHALPEPRLETPPPVVPRPQSGRMKVLEAPPTSNSRHQPTDHKD